MRPGGIVKDEAGKVLLEIPASVGVGWCTCHQLWCSGREKGVSCKWAVGYSGGLTSNRNKPIAKSTILRKPNSTVNPAKAVVLEIVK